jgi:hypothetical protein
MNWEYKALLTAAIVAIVLTVSRTFGQRIGGLCAGLPVVSALTLIWLALDQGSSFAAESATGIIAASGASAAFIVSYEWLSRRWPAALVLPISLIPAAALSIVAMRLHLSAGWIFAASIGLCVGGLACLNVPKQGALAAKNSGKSLLLTVVSAGLICATVTSQSIALGPFHSGLLAALPIAGASIIVNYHLMSGHTAVPRFARGYIAGLSGQATFATVFSLAVAEAGAGIALGLSLAAGATTTLIAARAFAKQKLYRTPVSSVPSRRDLRDNVIY